MLALLAIPAALLLVAGLLAVAAWAEALVLSPTRMIVAAARTRRGSVESAERLVAHEFERLLRLAQR